MSLAKPIRRIETDDGVSLAVYHLGGRSEAPPLLWGHANGFCAGSYDALLRDLAADHNVWAWDMRGQGQSPLPPDAQPVIAMQLDRVAADATIVCAAVQEATGQVPHAAGHSFGALALLHAARHGAPWRSGCFFEPPIPVAAMLDDPQHEAASATRIADTLRRRRRWPSPESFAARLRQHPGHAGIADAVLETHARAALRPDEQEWTLRCSPEVEAAVYRLTFSAAVQDALRPIDRPMLFVASAVASPSWIAAAQTEAAARSGGCLLQLPDTTHLLPLEQPVACAAAVRSLTYPTAA